MEVWVSVLVGTMEHYGTRRRGERFRCSRQIAEKLAARGLVSIDGEADSENPTGADGETSSASPADQASGEQTPNSSGSGETPDSDNPPESENPPATAKATPAKGGRRRSRKAG